jgi:superfamily II RNA helicase
MGANETDVASIELEFYERFFIDKGLEPYPVQEEALRHIFAGEGVLVTVPTGTGKTLIAKAALLLALRQKKTGPTPKASAGWPPSPSTIIPRSAAICDC